MDSTKRLLSDYVWYDSNKDGYQDNDEKGIKGVKVTLKDSEGNTLKQLKLMKMVSIALMT